MLPGFPFSAIVGQETLKRALLLATIEPTLGGVLVRGTKGVAKSTAVRALAGLLPPIECVAGCPFRRRPGEEIPDWPLPEGTAVSRLPVPLVELPLGATEDRVLGSLHLEKALRGERAFEPGLLAAANRGILYIDEVNLLPDHLVDILLDAAASGVHRVEREGLSLTHPAAFVLIGTMNPEEGELRPQLLDRFGLVVDVADLENPKERAEAVRRRLAFERDPRGFVAEWQAADAAEADRVVESQRLLPEVRIAESLLHAISVRCLAAGVEGLRADLTLCKAACAWAAYHGRHDMEAADIDAVAELALGHRRTEPPLTNVRGSENQALTERRPSRDREGAGSGQPPTHLRGSENQAPAETRQSRDHERAGSGQPPTHLRGSENRYAADPASGAVTGIDSPRMEPQGGQRQADLHFEPSGVFTARPRPRSVLQSEVAGRWREGAAARRGAHLGAVRQDHKPECVLAWSATLRAAALHQSERGRKHADPMKLRFSDLRVWPRRGPAGWLLLFLIDASGSMAAWQRMRQTKAAVLALLLQAYQRRDRVALLAFREQESRTLLPPRRGLNAALQALGDLAVGGGTPLALGLEAARSVLRHEQRCRQQQALWMVVLTDGRANVARDGQDPWLAALCESRLLAALGVEILVVDTETSWPRLGWARLLARALGAGCLRLEEVLGSPQKPGRFTA